MQIAIEAANIARPRRVTSPITFRRCDECGERNLVNDEWFECAICGAELSRDWNFSLAGRARSMARRIVLARCSLRRMSSPLRRIDTPPVQCSRCGFVALCNHEEHVDGGLGIALARKFLWVARCPACGFVASRRLAKRSGAAEFPLTPPVRRWIVMSWVVVILLNLLVGVAFLWNRRLERAYSVEPVVGDRWTIETATWPYAMFDNAKYARVIVAGVAADSIELHACDMVADNQDAVRRECSTYPLSLESIPRSELPAIYDEAIADVDTDRDVYLPFLVTGGVGIALLIGLCVLGTSWQRRLTNGGQFSACSRSSTTASCRRSPRSRWAAG